MKYGIIIKHVTRDEKQDGVVLHRIESRKREMKKKKHEKNQYLKGSRRKKDSENP